jgi:hypothetical protein
VVISIAFGFLGRRPKDRVKYILWSLFLILLVGIGIRLGDVAVFALNGAQQRAAQIPFWTKTWTKSNSALHVGI